MSLEQGSFGKSISILNRAASTYFQRELAPYKLGPGQQAYLLAMIPGETIIQDVLSVRLKVDNANVTRAVKGLVELGYIQRVRSKEDKRSWDISLSENGVKTRKIVESIASNWVESLQDSLEPEAWKITVESLSKMAEVSMERTR